MLGGIVRGKLVTLRTPREEDLAFVNALCADMRVRREAHIWEQPAAMATWQERLTEAAKAERSVLWIVESDGRAVGIAQASWHSDPRHLDVHPFAIDPEHWGRGVGTDAAIALHRYLFDYLDQQSCAVEVAADNARALRVAGKLGYHEFGRGHDAYYRDGAYADKVFLRFDRADWDARWSAEREYAPLPEGITR